MGHGDREAAHGSSHFRQSIVFIDVSVAQMYQDNLFKMYVEVRVAEIDAVGQSEVILRMTLANLILFQILQKSPVVVVTLDHDAVDVFEAILAFYGVGHEHYSLPGRSFYQEAVIWHVVGDFKWLDGKSSNVGF